MNKRLKLRQILLFAVLSAAAVWLDQFTKHLALLFLGDHEPVVLIPGVLEFLRIENDGAAFGILKGHMAFFYAITAFVGLIVLYVLVKLPTERKYMPLLVILSFISAGAAGNFIDRVMRRSVVDFIYFVPIDFPVFNVADIFVTCSTALLVILVLFYYQESDFNFLKDGARKKKP